MAQLNFTKTLILLLINFLAYHTSQACPVCPYPNHPPKKPNLPPKHHPKTPPHKPKAPPKVPKTPITKPPHIPKPPVVIPHPPVIPKPHPPVIPKPPIVNPPVIIPKPPIVNPPVIPNPPIVYPPPVISPSPPQEPPVTPPQETPCPPPPPPPKEKGTCPIDTLKLGACVDVLGGLVHIGIGSNAKDKCCPVLGGLLGLDAAICLCDTIKLRLLNINIILPIALQVLIDCGKTPPEGFKCAA